MEPTAPLLATRQRTGVAAGGADGAGVAGGGLARRRAAGACMLGCAALLALGCISLGGRLLNAHDEMVHTALYGFGNTEPSIAADLDGLHSLRHVVSAAVSENRALAGEFSHMVNDERLAKCTSLRDSGCSPQVVDNYLKTVAEATAGDPNEGCCGKEGAAPGAAPDAPGDESVGAVVRALEAKFASCDGVRSSGYGTHTSPAPVAVPSGISTAGLGTVLLARAAREAFGRREPPATVFSIAMTIEIWCDFFLFLLTLSTVIVILENCWFY